MNLQTLLDQYNTQKSTKIRQDIYELCKKYLVMLNEIDDKFNYCYRRRYKPCNELNLIKIHKNNVILQTMDSNANWFDFTISSKEVDNFYPEEYKENVSKKKLRYLVKSLNSAKYMVKLIEKELVNFENLCEQS